MKKILFLLSICIYFQISNAQGLLSDSDKMELHKQFVTRMMQFQSHTLEMANKTNATPSYRVVSQSTHDNGLSSISDSVKVSYQGIASSNYDYNTMVYNYNYPYNTSPLFAFNGQFSKPQIQYSHYTHWQINPNTLVYGFYQKDFLAYDGSLNLTSDTAFYADSLTLPNMLHINKFNAANKIESSYSFKYHGGIVDSAFKQYFVYDGSNNLVKDSMYEFHAGTWSLVARSFYTYSGAGNLTLIDQYSNVSDTTFLLPLIEQLQYSNTYDASNRLITVQTSFHDGSLLRPYIKDTFDYTGALSFHTSWREHVYDRINTRWEPTYAMSKHLNAASLPDTINIEGYNRIDSVWIPAARYICKYDTNNNPIQLRDYEYNFSSFPATPDFTTYYFYESYINNTGIENTLTVNNIKLFPNPSSSMINIDGLDKDDFWVNVTIIDLNGRLYSSQDLLISNGSSSISVADLSSGAYIMLITSQEGVLAKQSTFIKE